MSDDIFVSRMFNTTMIISSAVILVATPHTGFLVELVAVVVFLRLQHFR